MRTCRTMRSCSSESRAERTRLRSRVRPGSSIAAWPRGSSTTDCNPTRRRSPRPPPTRARKWASIPSSSNGCRSRRRESAPRQRLARQGEPHWWASRIDSVRRRSCLRTPAMTRPRRSCCVSRAGPVRAHSPPWRLSRVAGGAPCSTSLVMSCARAWRTCRPGRTRTTTTRRMPAPACAIARCPPSWMPWARMSSRGLPGPPGCWATTLKPLRLWPGSPRPRSWMPRGPWTWPVLPLCRGPCARGSSGMPRSRAGALRGR